MNIATTNQILGFCRGSNLQLQKNQQKIKIFSPLLYKYPNSHSLLQSSCRLDPDKPCLGKVCSRLSPAAGFSEAPGPITGHPPPPQLQERSALRAWGLFYAADPVFEMWRIIVSMHANGKCLTNTICLITTTNCRSKSI